MAKQNIIKDNNLMSSFLLKTLVVENDLYRDRFNLLDEKVWSSKNFEMRGAREKALFYKVDQKELYLFKKPKYGKMEIYTEVFNSVLANELKINHVQYFPAKFRNTKGILCKSFLNEYGKQPFGLTEMKILICRYSGQPDLDERKGGSIAILKEHNIKNIFNIIKNEGYSDDVLENFFTMIGFDALIGHGDRHWCNYGFLSSKSKENNVKFAPIYDTASGYLTEITEDLKLKNKLLQLDDEDWYQSKAKIKGLCKITVPGDYCSTHFDLLKYILEDKNMNKYKASISLAFIKYNPCITQVILKTFFPFLTKTRKQIILKILNKRHSIGMKIITRKNI